uniref:DUF1640 domain-containing protein n=1 Tax=Candidatus Kentrum sp. LPFa TaxID=2126335 RepID=A0A450Y0L8_9GAMM|nr:MAG: hypothetical protein BECKLPF1236A_GA0070988_103525 [Candidatus Kentron sp. LPFa]VFK35080.1 MAG: hypothetical protein BECKLPF1236C_GA0070990_103304 [Candidatus Kentron sp. LPFa]
MTAITFDTHQFIKTLKDAEFSEQQAKAISNAFKNAQQAAVTIKVDLREMELRINSELRCHRWILTFIAVAIVIPIVKDLF